MRGGLASVVRVEWTGEGAAESSRVVANGAIKASELLAAVPLRLALRNAEVCLVGSLPREGVATTRSA